MKLSKSKKSIIILIVVFAMLITGIGGLINFSASKNENNVPYLTVGDVSFTFPEYNIFYVLYINEFVNNYAYYLDDWGLDVNKDFAKQQYDDDNTWEDVFKEATNKQIKQFVALNKDIKDTKTNIDTTKQVDELMNIFSENAKYASLSYEDYLKKLFGENVTEKDIKRIVKYKYDAIDYSNKLYDILKKDITEKDLISVYSDYPATFDKIAYRIMAFDDVEKADKLAESIKSEDEFIEIAKENGQDSSLQEDIGTNTLTDDELISWLYDQSRKAGDIASVKGDQNYVVFFKNREICNDRTVDFRHIFYNTDGASAEEKKEIENKAKAAFDILKNDKKTEEDFETYVFIYSDDSTTSQKGGIMEGIKEDSVDAPLNDWLFDDARKKGDIELIETSLGYHIVYFIGLDDVYWKVEAKKYLTDKLYNDYLEKLLDKQNAEAE